jgi:hypothetical protein
VPFKLVNNGKTRFEIVNSTYSWTFDNDGELFNISRVGTGLNEFRVSSVGNIFARGNSYAVNHVNTSSRKMKHDIQPLDEREVLSKLMQLPVSTWKYNSDENGAPHMGPMAEDFHNVFGLNDGQHLSTVDTDGVALAAIQGLYKVVKEENAQLHEAVKEKDAQIMELSKRLSALEELIFTKNTVPGL